MFPVSVKLREPRDRGCGTSRIAVEANGIALRYEVESSGKRCI